MKYLDRVANAAIIVAGRYRALLLIAAAVLAAWARSPGQSLRPRGTTSNPETAVDWFRRADDLTNTRTPKSPPFHLKVAFHAYPPIDFNQSKGATRSNAPLPGHPFVIDGEGTYEETWVSPEKWRREVTLGTYRAVEVRANGVRKLHSTSEYVPGRVLMLLDALLEPIHRFNLEPVLEEHPWKWKVELLTAGSIQYVRISHVQVLGQNDFSANLDSFEFLRTGILVRRTISSLATTWQDDIVFAGKIVPRTVRVRSMEANLLDARVSIEPLEGKLDSSRFELSGPPAEPGVTLQNVSSRARAGTGALSEDPPPWPPEMAPPPGAGLRVWVTVDRTGIPREMELVAASPPPPAKGPIPTWLSAESKILFRSVQRMRYQPPTVDNSPCESFAIIDAIHGTN